MKQIMTCKLENHTPVDSETKHKISMWYGDKFIPMRYHADATFYPHGSFGYSYRGNIYDDSGKKVGDYAASDSCWIEKNFRIEWR